MGGHGRDKKVGKTSSARQRRQGRRDRAAEAGAAADGHGGEDAADDLADEYSIFGGSSAGSALDDEGELSLDEASPSDRLSRLDDALSLAHGLTSEKRGARREAGYRTIFRAVTQHAAGPEGREALSGNWEGLWEACRSSVSGTRGARPEEQYAACRVLEACSVVFGGDADEVALRYNGPLKRAVAATGRAANVRAAALRCLSTCHFVCGTGCLEDGEDASSVMDLCEEVAGGRYRGEDVAPSLRAAALDCWSLLATTLNDLEVSGDGTGRGMALLPLLAGCLDQPDAGLRRSAGEALALIHECRLGLGLTDDEGANATDRRYGRGTWEGCDPPEMEGVFDSAAQRVSELSVEGTRSMSRAARKRQRSDFRDFAATVVDDEPPDEEVSFQGGRVRLSSWREIVQLGSVRHCLQGGFQIQLMTNETLREIFSATFEASGASLSQLEKRLFMSKTSEASKAADRAMARNRRARDNVKNHFLTTDGEEI